MLRFRSAVESETHSVDHVRPQQQHQHYVTPGAVHPPSLNPKVPPYPRGSKTSAPQKLEGVPGRTDLEFLLVHQWPAGLLILSATTAQLFTIHCSQLVVWGLVKYGTSHMYELIHPFFSTVSDSKSLSFSRILQVRKIKPREVK